MNKLTHDNLSIPNLQIYTQTIKWANTQTTDIPVDDSINNDLNGVLVSEQVNDFHGVLDNPDSHELLAIVSTVHHEGVGEPLNNGALCLPETLHRVPTSSVRNICRMLRRHHSNIISQRNVIHLIPQKKSKINPNISDITKKKRVQIERMKKKGRE